MMLLNENISFGGRRVAGFGVGAPVGLGDIGDLLAYRQMWEPFIKAHLDLWRAMNVRFEAREIELNKTQAPMKKPCPDGVFTNAQIPQMEWGGGRSWCAALTTTRMMISVTDPDGIQPRWNAWQNKSSFQILAGAPDMLKWLQDVVLQVGGPDRDKLLAIAKEWGVEIKLPDLPTFSMQDEVRARIEGAYITTKGILQIIGYGAEETMKLAGSTTQAVADGLSDTAKALPGIPKAIANPALWLGIAAIVAVVGAGVLIYYVPRRQPETRREPEPERLGPRRYSPG